MILIRVDGNERVGLGHVMRCLSIADALRSINEDVLFVTADDKCTDLLTQRGYRSAVLHTDYSVMDSESERFFELIDEYQPHTVLVDSYFVTDSCLRRLKEKVRLVYLDDRLSFPYPVDVLINYNIFSDPEAYARLYQGAEIIPQFVLGTEYTPLRAEFSQVITHEQPVQAKNILISTGGADSQHIALQLIRSIIADPASFDPFIFTFIIGGANTDIDVIRSLTQDSEQIKIMYNVQNISELMLQNDIAVSAAGSTLYELCACGIPTITYVLADNQIPAAKVFGDRNIMIDAGDYRTDTAFIPHLFAKIRSLADDRTLRQKMANAATRVADGRGANRLAKMISK